MSVEVTDIGRSRAESSALPDDSLFRNHFENLPDPAYVWRRAGDDFVLIAHNRAAGALHFSKVAEYHGMRASELQSMGESSHNLRADLDFSATHGVVVKREIDHRYLTSSTVRRLLTNLVPLSRDIVVLHTDDVTESRRTEQALRDSENTYRTIVDTAHDGIWAFDRGVTTYINRRAAEMLGYEPAEILGRDVFDFIDESLHEEARRIRERRYAGIKEQFDFRLRHKSGAEVWVSVAASPLTDSAGKVTGAIHMIADITERKRSEQALRESEAKVRALLDAHPDMIVRVTGDGDYLDVHSNDPNFAQYLPRAPNEFLGRNVRDIFDAGFAQQHERYRRLALTTGTVQRWEYQRPSKYGDRYLEARFVKAGDDEVVITIRDITQHVELEREVIASSERERTRIGHDLHDGLAQLLIGVKLLLEALEERLAATESPHRSDAQRAADLVTRAIAQTGDLAQGLSPIRKGGRLCDALKQLARQSEQLFGVTCETTRLDVPTNLDEGAATHLYRIAQEAITNAVKHGKATHIEVACERVQHRLLLTIADDGCGLGGPVVESGGMGMHIMRYRARSIGGEVTVTARPEGGTLVQCACPRPAAQPSPERS